MEDIANQSPSYVDYNEFEEDGNDSDLEGRLYAQIYYSNEVYDPGENFEDSIKNIQDIKNASRASNQMSPKLIQNNQLELKNADNPSNSSNENCSPIKDQTDLVSAEKGEVSSHVDKNLNLQKQVNLETHSNNIPRAGSNKIVDGNVNPLETPDKNRTPKKKTSKQKKNKTPEIMNRETENSCTQKATRAVKSVNKKKRKVDGSPQVLNNSLTTPKCRKRILRVDKNSGGNSKRRSLESDKSVSNCRPKSANGKSDGDMSTPVSLNGRKSSDETNLISRISPATMAILFPTTSIGDKLKGIKKKKRRIKTKIKAANIKDNSKQSKKAPKSSQEDEIIEVISSDSSKDSSDEILPIIETPRVERRKQNEESEKEMPVWLGVPSDSDSDESIFEVPVPPKPPPLLIDLSDSESVSSDGDDSSSDGIHDLNSKSQSRNVTFSCSTSNSEDSPGSEDNSRVSKKTPQVDSVESSTENVRSPLFSEQLNPTDEESSKDNSRVAKEPPEVISVDNSTENSIEISVVDTAESTEENARSRISSEQSNPKDEASDSSYSDFPVDERIDSIGENLILKCTQVQKGAKSLEEIKKLGKVAVSTELEASVAATEYTEYVEPLNDLAEPSTSKASGSASKKKSPTKKEIEKTRKSSKEKTDVEYFFEPMSDKIKAFYNDSWGGEEFSVEETQNKMRKDPRFWAILDEDWKPDLKRQRYFLNKTKCTLCRQSGHLRANCPEPKKGPVCHMCGAKGHYETRCPHKICLTCGKKQNTFRQTCESCMKITCTLCRSRGHKKDSCPDHWRQFHHTTSEAEHHPPKNASEVMKPSNSLFCCNCTMRGHESSTCNKYRWTQHYPTPPRITSYSKCIRMLSASSANKPAEVVNLTESPGVSSRNLINNIEHESISDEEMSQYPTKDNSTTTTSTSKTSAGTILFEIKYENIKARMKKKKLKKLIGKPQSQIVLSDVKGANLEGLIAGTFKPKSFQRLCLHMACDICIKLVEGTKVVMNVTYYQFFTKQYIFKKLICFWVQLSDDEKQNLTFNLTRKTPVLILRLDKSFKKFDKLSGDVKVIYEKVETLTNELKKEVRAYLTKRETRQLCGRIQTRDQTLKTLVQLLFKNNCAVEKEAVSNLRKLHKNLQESDINNSYVPLDIYLPIYYYYSLIFGKYRPSNLEEMVQKYLALNKGSANRSISNTVSSENSKVAIEECSDKDFDKQQHLDQVYNNQKHVEQQHIDQNHVHQTPVPPRRSLQKNRPSPSIPSHLEVSPRNFPQKFYPEESGYPSSGCSYTQQRRSNQFEFPVDEFIPISNYHPSEFLEPSPHFNNRRGDSRQYRKNPMHNLNTFNPRAPQTSDRLISEASYLMHRALQFNLPQLTKAGIQLGELINQNRVKWKHINYFRNLINSQHARGFR